MLPARTRHDPGTIRFITAAALLALSLGAACGGGAPPPSPTTGASAVPSVSVPPRPSLASPVASPSAAPTVGISAGSTPSSAASGETYTVQPGDTLLVIAEKVYGDSTKWRRIYDANTDVIGADPDTLKVEMKLKIPPKE